MGIKSSTKKKGREQVQVLLNMTNNYSDTEMQDKKEAKKVFDDFDQKVREMESSLRKQTPRMK
jgi:hypothetical protein